jgi:predicted dehydrogenase
MAPITFGIIGTSWITHDYVSHAQATGQFQLRAVYSRTEEKAKEFASRYDTSIISFYTDLDKLAADPNITAVYVASPNLLHYEQTKKMLNAGKNVILEKPSVSTSAELDELFQLAYSKNLFLIEAFRHVHEVNFKVLKSNLARLGPLLGATVNFCQFSSRYDAVLKGETPNVFNLEFGGGALCDLGVYHVAFAVELFGPPQSAKYYPVIIGTGADGGGTLILQYDNFTVNLIISKMFNTSASTDVYGQNGTITVPTITDIETVSFYDPRKKTTEQLGKKKEDLNLKEEATEHARIILEKDVEAMKRWEKHSKAVLKITEGARRDNGLLFPVERK